MQRSVTQETKKRVGRLPNATTPEKARRTTVPVYALDAMRSEIANNQRIISSQEQELAKLSNEIEYLSKALEQERNKPVPGADPYGEWAKRSVPELIDLLRDSQP